MKKPIFGLPSMSIKAETMPTGFNIFYFSNFIHLNQIKTTSLNKNESVYALNKNGRTFMVQPVAWG